MDSLVIYAPNSLLYNHIHVHIVYINISYYIIVIKTGMIMLT
jgi:hypothetical protein